MKMGELSKDIFARERRLRRLATKRGYALVRPWAGDTRGVGDLHSCFVLVPHNSGMNLDEVEDVLMRDKRQRH